MGSIDTEVILEIENIPVKCNRDDLISNSDYFKAMLEGNFVERNQDVIKLKGVDLKAMNIILSVLWDESIVIPNEDILLVLHTACMLQFEKIRDTCLERITEILSPKNCIKIWRVTEQLDINPLYLKAKAMALEEFLEIKDTDCVLEFTLEEIYYYLGHINLKTDSEISVFQTAMKWWYENGEKYIENATSVLTKLLSCIDFRNLTCDCLKEIMVYPDIVNNGEILQILECILLLKSNKSVEHFSEICQQNASLMYKSKSRITSRVPCILVNYVYADKEIKNQDKERTIICYDKYKRKRLYEVMDKEYKTDMLSMALYDYNSGLFKKLLDIDDKKSSRLDGFKLAAYKEFVFMYGGEFLIGKGNWNYNFWVYDTIRERWERKCVLPFPRRHFETCMVDDILFIVGGTGVFRVIQENILWYSYKEDKWSSQISLPCCGRQLKCCSFLGKLFIFNINNKCGYFFDYKTSNWLKMDIIIDDTLINKEAEFVIFSFRDKLYMKGKHLIEFKVAQNEIVVVCVKELSNVTCDKMELVLCDNIAYTLYKCKSDDEETYFLETYNLDTGKLDFVFRDVPCSYEVIDIDGEKFAIHPSLKLLSFQHYSLAESNNLVNDYFA